MSALLFPGQGSQHTGMGKFLFDNFKVAKETFEEASEALSLDIKKLCFEGSDSELALTENTQPAIVCVSVATQRVVKELVPTKASAVAGHSVGEYSAMVAAEVLNFADAIKAVRIRGQAMQQAVPVGQGSMAAVLGLESEQVKTVCEWAVQTSGLGPLSPANYNSPGQVVISGSAKTIDWLKNNFDPEKNPQLPKKLKMIPLTVSAPFHCEMMKPAEEKMKAVLNALPFKDAKIPVSQNFTSRLTYKAQDLRENLIKQISAPVLWTQSMIELRTQNLTTCIECGAGKVLQGLLKKIDPQFQVWTTTSLDEIKALEQAFKAH